MKLALIGLVLVPLMAMGTNQLPATAEEGPPTFASETIVQGEGLVRAEVFLPIPASHQWPAQNPDTTDIVQIEGGGDGLVAFLFAPHGQNTWSHVVRPPGAAHDQFGWLRSFRGCEGFTCQLQPGMYSVVLLTETPATVTLRLDGLEGLVEDDEDDTITIEASIPVEGKLHHQATHVFDPQTDLLQGGDAAVGAGWLDEQSGELNFSFGAFWFDGAQESPTGIDDAIVNVGLFTSCTYTEFNFIDVTRPYIDPVAFGPGCPAGGNGFPSGSALVGFKTRGLRWTSASPTAGGNHGRGGWSAHTGANNPAAAGFWFDQTWHLPDYGGPGDGDST